MFPSLQDFGSPRFSGWKYVNYKRTETLSFIGYIKDNSSKLLHVLSEYVLHLRLFFSLLVRSGRDIMKQLSVCVIKMSDIWKETSLLYWVEGLMKFGCANIDLRSIPKSAGVP